MAGFYNQLWFDPGYELAKDELNERQYDYNLTRNAVMRQNVVQAPFLSAGRAPEFYGPLVGNRVTRESFMQGRGAIKSKSPQCEVTYLPESLFPAHTVRTKVDRVDLESFYTRLPRSCNGLAETEVTPYRQSAEDYKRGYQGYNAVVHTQIQSRIGPPDHARKYDPCATNYASYAPTRNMAPYQ